MDIKDDRLLERFWTERPLIALTVDVDRACTRPNFDRPPARPWSNIWAHSRTR